MRHEILYVPFILPTKELTMILLLLFAFFAGFITILSPCILSIAPILLAASMQHNYYKPLGIITGVIISFSFFTLTLTAIIQATGISPNIFRYIALSIIIFFGLTMIIPALENAFIIITNRISRIGNVIEHQSTFIKTEFISGLLLGIALGLIWTPCAGPILATITSIAATSGITLTTILLTCVYSIGAALPMLILCFGGTKIMQSTTSLIPYTHIIRQVFGIIIIVSAVAIIMHVDTFIQEKIAHFFPNISIENNDRLQKELNMLHLSSETSSGMIAPEFVGITAWINSEPLTLAQLKGKVVLVDFWTYTCINCIRTLPHITEWYTSYKDKGLEIIGVHTPEFAFEKDESHVQDAVKRFNITYPVALDNDYQTWRAYNNLYWPAHYLINQQGIIVKTHFGEGNYVEMEDALRALLNLPPCQKTEECASTKPLTPETYLGFERGDKYHSSLHIQQNKSTYYTSTKDLDADQVSLSGQWTVRSDCIHSDNNTNELSLNFMATHVYLVMKSDKPQLITLLLDDKPIPHNYYTKDMNSEGKILVHQPRMYELLDLKNDYGRHTLTLQCPQGIIAYVFTFGGENELNKS